MKENNINESCPVCKYKVNFFAFQKGNLDKRDFKIFRCNNCNYYYVKNYRSDFDNIYNENYYKGKGADPYVDYIYELENIEITIRNYEWQGIFQIYKKNFPRCDGRWLDFGCGAGGLVNYAKNKGIDIIGVEDGWAAEMGRALGISILNLNELDDYIGYFDFISAIEVFEHIPDPVNGFKFIRKLLRPGGILFLTTGNAKPWRNNFLNWSYTQCPDVHISFFEPNTIAYCLEHSGFKAKENISFLGFTNIIKFKVLKNMKFKKRNMFIDILPWGLIARVVDSKYQVSKMPYGVVIE